MKRLLFFLPLLLLLSGCRAEEYKETRFLMDTVCTVQAESKEAVTAAFSAITEVERVSDFYGGTSTVSAFNRAKAGEQVPLDPHTEAMIKTALAVSEASGGAFDITIAPVKDLWNFTEGATPPTREELQKVLPQVGFTHLVLDTQSHTLTKTKDGVKIDLGAVAKGYASDIAKSEMIEAGTAWGIIDLGGNVLVFGKNPKSRDGSWEVGIQKPFGNAGEYEKTALIEDAGAVVTSGLYQRNFTYDGKLYHHILDPQTGYPVENNLISASVSGHSALLADCLSTACFVLGKEEGQGLCDAFLMNFIPITTEEP